MAGDEGAAVKDGESGSKRKALANEADESLYRFFPPTTREDTATAAASLEVLDNDGDLALQFVSSACPQDNKATCMTISFGRCKSTARQKVSSSNTGSGSNSAGSSSGGSNINSNEDECDEIGVPVVSASSSSDSGSCTTSTSASEVPTASMPTTTSQLLFLVRHGQTDMNKAGRLQGRGVNTHLNDAGMEQAEALGRFVANIPFDTVTSSSLHRAHETAMQVAVLNAKCVKRAQDNGSNKAKLNNAMDRQGKTTPVAKLCRSDNAQVLVRQVEGLDELSWGELEGKDYSEDPWKGRLAKLKAAWDAGHYDSAANGGESLIEVEARSRAAVEACLDSGDRFNLVVSHGRTLRILMLSLAGLGLDKMTLMGKVPNASMYIVEARRSGPGAARSYRLLKFSR